MVFPVVMYGCESWTVKKAECRTVVLEKTLESPLDCKEIQPVHSEGDQSWVFFGRNDAKAETPVLWPPHAKDWLIGKDSDDGRDWGQEEKGTTEDEMAGWHHRLNGCEFEWTPGVGDGQGGLACCNSWGRRVGHDWVTELKGQSVWGRQGNASFHPSILYLNFFFLSFKIFRSLEFSNGKQWVYILTLLCTHGYKYVSCISVHWYMASLVGVLILSLPC